PSLSAVEGDIGGADPFEAVAPQSDSPALPESPHAVPSQPNSILQPVVIESRSTFVAPESQVIRERSTERIVEKHSDLPWAPTQAVVRTKLPPTPNSNAEERLPAEISRVEAKLVPNLQRKETAQAPVSTVDLQEKEGTAREAVPPNREASRDHHT